MKRRWLAVLFWIPFGIAAPEAPGLSWAEVGELRTFNPLVPQGAVERRILRDLNATLLRWDPEAGRLAPYLASSWRADPAAHRLTLRLREGALWSDGKPVTADDVVFTLRAALDPAVRSPYADSLRRELPAGSPDPAIEAADAGTVTVRFDRAAPSFLDALALVPIVPRHLLGPIYAQGAGAFRAAWGIETKPESLATAGAFRVKRYAPGERIECVPNPRFFGSASLGGAPPAAPIAIRLARTDAERTAWFLKGETTALDPVPYAQLDAARAAAEQAGGALRAGTGAEVVALWWNLGTEERRRRFPRPLRKGVESRLRRAGLQNELFPRVRGAGPAASGWIGEWMGAADAGEPSAIPQQERGTTISLLVEAGNAELEGAARRAAALLETEGVKVLLEPVSHAILYARTREGGSFDAALAPLGGGDPPDPLGWRPLLDPASPGCLWRPGASDRLDGWEQELADAWKELAARWSPEDRREPARRIAEQLASAAPLACLYARPRFCAVRERWNPPPFSGTSRGWLWNWEGWK